MIHRELVIGAEAMNRTWQLSSGALPDLVVALAIGIELCHHELLMHLWALEE